MPRKVKEYSLHVLANGNEVLFAELPHVPLEPLHWMRLLRDYKGPSVAHVHHVALLELRDGSTVEEINIPSIKSTAAKPSSARSRTVRDGRSITTPSTTSRSIGGQRRPASARLLVRTPRISMPSEGASSGLG